MRCREGGVRNRWCRAEGVKVKGDREQMWKDNLSCYDSKNGAIFRGLVYEGSGI